MFTGIVTNLTDTRHSRLLKGGLSITFTRPESWKNMELGQSVATNGVCLTVSGVEADTYECYLMPETLDKTSFGSHVPKTVNLERPLRAGDEFGGHFVQGHVDCVGTVANIDTSDGYRLFVDFPTHNRALVIPKGSITIDGVSLTVIDVTNHTLSVGLIPQTLSTTTLKGLQTGDKVNLEFDMIGKYIINVMEQGK